MKRLLVVLGVAAGVMLMAGPSWAVKNQDQWNDSGWHEGNWTGNFNITLGGKYLDDDDWNHGMDEQGELGISLDLRERDWPLSLLIQVLGSSSDESDHGIDFTGKTNEYRIGVRKIFEPDRTIRPFIGGGVASVWAKQEADDGYMTLSDHDTALGVFIDGGVYFTLNRAFNLGLEVGYSSAEVTLFDEDMNAGGGHAALLLGYHW